MNKYAQIALLAADLVDKGDDPVAAWEYASCSVLKKGSSSQTKSCPKNTFLGIYGVNTTSKNGMYARKAKEWLDNNPETDITAEKLWEIVMDGEEKKHNSQMEVVLELHRNKKI